MQHVRVMQNSMKAVEKHDHEGLNLELERTKRPEEKECKNVRGKKGRRHTHFCCPSTGPARGDRGPCARVVPKGKV